MKVPGPTVAITAAAGAYFAAVRPRIRRWYDDGIEIDAPVEDVRPQVGPECGTVALDPLPGGRTRLREVRAAPDGAADRIYRALGELPHVVRERRRFDAVRRRSELHGW